MTAPAPRVRALSIHAGYRCRSTGVCCSSGWDVPVEPEVEARLRSALASGTLRVAEAAGTSSPPTVGADEGGRCFRAVPGLPHGARVVLAADSSGRCVFLDPDRRCTVHRHLGPWALASACRDFPRTVTLTPLGVSITLSHYCPTAAAMLFVDAVPRDDSQAGPGDPAVAILENPPGFPPDWPYEGLDARDALPPHLRPGVLMDWPSLERWESFAVAVLGDGTREPEAALDLLAAVAEDARKWRSEDGSFEDHFERVLSSRGAPSAPGSPPSALGMGQAWRLVAGCIPHRALVPPAPDGLADADERLVAPAWRSLGVPVRRWLAAKAFASWTALQGEGLRTTVLGLRVALGVLRAEAARACVAAGRGLEAELLKEAFRRADLLLVHLVDPAALGRQLSRGEAPGPPPPAW